jgi:hypothetical protein
VSVAPIQVVFQDINKYAAPPATYHDPFNPIHMWTMPVLKAWLKARHEGEYTKLKVGQSTEWVYHLTDHVESPPSIRPPLYAKLSDVINLLISMSDMVRLLMTDHVTEEMCVCAEALVKLFLSRVDVVDYDMFHDLGKYVPMWIKKSNLIGMLNLPD